MLIQGHLQGEKVNSKVKTCWYYQQMEITASVIPLFDVFLTEELSCSTILMIKSDTILMIKGHPQG